MNQLINTIRADRVLFSAFLLDLVVLFITITSIALFYNRLPPFIPLFNQMPWGAQRLGTKEQIVIPFAISLLIFVGNFISSTVFYKKMPLVARILCITSFLISLFTFLFVVRTIQLAF